MTEDAQDATGQAQAQAQTVQDSPEPTAAPPLAVSPLAVTKRLMKEGRWKEIEPLRDQMMREARKTGRMNKEQAQAWTYGELDRLYPPISPPEPLRILTSDSDSDGPATQDIQDNGVSISDGEDVGQSGGAHAREGLGGIPKDWPELPDNAPLAVELGWVQSQRLRIVEEKANGQAIVRLERAGSPPPSWAALGWLETSIRSYAKFVDICAKGLASQELESDLVRRERRSIEDVRRLLAEMLETS